MKRTEGEPHDRLTALCDRMLAQLDTEDGNQGIKAIVMLKDGDTFQLEGGIGMRGYDDEGEVVEDLLKHLKALFEVNGKQLFVTTIGEG